MDLYLQAGALAFFWGSLLSNFIWVNRKTIKSSGQRYASGALIYVIGKSKKIFKKDKHQQPSHRQQQQPKPQEQPERFDKEAVEKEQEAREKQAVRRKREKERPSRNRLRRQTRNYEEWFIRKAEVRRMESQLSTNDFKQQMKQLQDLHNEDLTFKKSKMNLEKPEIFAKYVQEQIDQCEQQPGNNVLPYDPFASYKQQ